ncbi:hypothetical protein [Pseudemcibacter aquimaris]|uniref:hypothetical protein n=1 Tax=Pseudemcibacter aquimaris TaxID=2857064 RepID=UPI0020128152|nr:hypothetical protein [Pseudemcibacter aquimaris]MCC3862269.1 hypothetical protein [Pseudemcibacter aquimaris]WDU59019.1 hypothetical protein KW060_01880 [Pseudemcibacter aquimaris]
MLLVFIAIFISLSVIIKTYKRIDNDVITQRDVLIACGFAAISIFCLTLRVTYFALPDEGMVSIEYLNYRRYLIWGFLLFMGYILRAIVFGTVYLYRRKN